MGHADDAMALIVAFEKIQVEESYDTGVKSATDQLLAELKLEETPKAQLFPPRVMYSANSQSRRIITNGTLTKHKTCESHAIDTL